MTTRDKSSSSSISDRVRAEQAEAHLARLVEGLEALEHKLLVTQPVKAERFGMQVDMISFNAVIAIGDEVRALIAAAKQEPT